MYGLMLLAQMARKFHIASNVGPSGIWCGGEQSFKEFTGPDKMRITLPDEYVEKYFKKV